MILNVQQKLTVQWVKNYTIAHLKLREHRNLWCGINE